MSSAIDVITKCFLCDGEFSATAYPSTKSMLFFCDKCECGWKWENPLYKEVKMIRGRRSVNWTSRGGD